jgi:tetratricopeptide (TPR) repeat protein
MLYNFYSKFRIGKSNNRVRNILYMSFYILTFSLGNTQNSQNFMVESLTRAQKQIDENPGQWLSVQGYCNKAVIYKKYGYEDDTKKMYANAKQTADKILSKDSVSDNAFRTKLTLAKMYYGSQKDYSGARKEYQVMVSNWENFHFQDKELIKELPALYLLNLIKIGECSDTLGDTSTGKDAYQKAISTQMFSADSEILNLSIYYKTIAQFRICDLYKKMGDKSKAFEAYKKVIDNFPDNIDTEIINIKEYKIKAKEQMSTIKK